MVMTPAEQQAADRAAGGDGCCHKTRLAGNGCPIGWDCPFVGKTHRLPVSPRPGGPTSSGLITDQMVEDGARALHDDMRSGQNYVRLWEDTSDGWKDAKRRQARAVLEAALAALRPELVWTEWERYCDESKDEDQCRLEYSGFPLVSMARDSRDIWWVMLSTGDGSQTADPGTDEGVNALRAEIERRVLEAMGWPS